MQLDASEGAVPDQTVFVVDGDANGRDVMQWSLQSAGLHVETFETAEEFLAAYDPSRGGCLVLEARLRGMSGLSLQEELAARHIGLPVIIVTGHAEVATAVRALRAGALDFIEKPFNHQFLLDQVRRAINKNRNARLLQNRRDELARRVAELTPRERAVMELVVAGRSNKVIALALAISHKTVEGHRACVMQKLQVDSLAELIRVGLEVQADNQTTGPTKTQTVPAHVNGNSQ